MLKKVCVLLFIAFTLSGCTKQNYEEVSFSSWGSVTEVQIMKNLISNFEKENPTIKINFMHIPQNYFQKLHLLFASNTPPDVIFINNLYLPLYQKYLEDLSHIIETDKFYAQSISSMSLNGHIYAVPRDISNLVLYVNVDILNQVPSREWTLEDLLRLSKIVTKKGQYGLSFEPSMYLATPYIFYYGGNDIEPSNDKTIEGLNFYKKLVTDYKVAPSRSEVGSSTLAQMFLDGKICFYLSGRWLYPKISEKANFNWVVVNFPYGEKGVPADVSGWAISKSSKHKEASYKFVKYLASKKSSEYFAETGLIVPAEIEASKLILKNNKHNESVFLDVVQHSTGHTVNKKYKETEDFVNKSLEL